ncbi:MAG TPA: hypothetical protein VFU15_13980 [Bacteroidia bacterium]|nr:hypothetical protein [Bacteroidia bacterium]
MKRNTLTLIIALALGGITFWLIRMNSSSSIKKELRDFAVSDTASITKIFLADKTMHQVTLTREKDGWKVDGKFDARPDAIEGLLGVIHDLSVREPVSIKSRPFVIKQLATGAVKCEIYNGSDLVKVYYVGGDTPDDLGTYMLLADPETGENSSEPFIMEKRGHNGYLTPYYSSNVIEWRDRSVFKYYAPDIRSIEVTNPRMPQTSFSVHQSANGVFGLNSSTGQPLPFDTLMVKQFISYFGHISFEAFEKQLTPAQRDSVVHSTPAHIITVTDAADHKNVVKLFLKKNPNADSTTVTDPSQLYDPDRMYATVNNGQDFVVVQYYVFGKLLPVTDYFLGQKVKEQNVVK